MAWCGLAVAAAWAGRVSGRKTLDAHGAIYLLLAVAGSGALEQSIGSLLGGASAAAGGGWPIWMTWQASRTGVYPQFFLTSHFLDASQR